MAVEDMLKLLFAITASFGTGAVIVIGLSKWLGGLWAGRILQNEQSLLQQALSEHAHELRLAQSSYERYLDLILGYYKMFYRHYRLCQRTTRADAHRKPDGTVTYTKDEFLAALDSMLEEWASREGEVRLLLPSPALSLHEEAIGCFNRFKRAVEAFDTSDATRVERKQAFDAIESVKTRIESQLREFLRTEKLLK